jgi:hypothetical protein
MCGEDEKVGKLGSGNATGNLIDRSMDQSFFPTSASSFSTSKVAGSSLAGIQGFWAYLKALDGTSQAHHNMRVYFHASKV